MSQTFVGSSGLGLRIAQRNFAPAGPSLEGMKIRFPTDRRASWRERFVAIARQSDPAATGLAEPRLPRLRIRLAATKLAHRLRPF